MRKIVHIDMDAFYASIEQRDNPQYRGKPLAVGFNAKRGVVAAASYEARAFGVRSAMSAKTALEKCPHLIFVNSRMDVYKAVSLQIRKIFFEYTDLVEPLSLDEAYLDVSANKKNIQYAVKIAKMIKRDIKEKTGLTASAGVSINKFLAKIASDIKKPNGLFAITPEKAESFVESLQIEKFWGVGKATAAKMRSLGVYTGKDLKKFSEIDLIKHFGKMGGVYYQNARAVDNRNVEPFRERKSVGAEKTFFADINDREILKKELFEIAKLSWERITANKFKGRTATLKVKFADFKVITHSKTLALPLNALTSAGAGDFEIFLNTAFSLLENVLNSKHKGKKIRLLGLSLSKNETPLLNARQVYFPF
ncbi:MAG: DNA polymerase IV [Endomicrobium sp.]|jgi:DNA polymerase-4|nr:DNA polymerase IV [Endomicrobium sp.]